MSDLTKEEQANVRTALRFLRARCGGWVALAKALPFDRRMLADAARNQAVSAVLAFRVSRLVGIPMDDLLSGEYPPPGVCPHCGHRSEGPTDVAR